MIESEGVPGIDFDFDLDAALALAAEAGGWEIRERTDAWLSIGWNGLDGEADLETRVLAVPWSATVGTRLPFALPSSYAAEATRICAALNRCIDGAVVTIAADGVPDVLTKTLLCAPERAAADAISAAVERNRARAMELAAVFQRVENGESADASAVDLGDELVVALSRQNESHQSTPLNLSWLPRLTDEQMGDAHRLADAGVSRVEETQALVQLELLREAQLQGLRDVADLPVCAGPLLVHADGVAECYGCAEPLAHLHPAGTSFQCRPDRAFGDGHRCGRCVADQADHSWHGERRYWGAPAYEVAVARLQELLPETWVWQLQGSPQAETRVWAAGTTTPETLSMQLSGGLRGGRVEVVLSDVEVPSDAHSDVVLFCLGANRAFTNSNIYLGTSDGPPGDGPAHVERVVSVGSFHADQSRGNVPPEVIQSFALHAIRAALVAAPAVRAIREGATVEDALAVADHHFDAFDEPWLRTI
jgi:hypothetical protein